MKIIIGRVTKDLEPRTSETGVTYVNFDVAENTGFPIRYFSIEQTPPPTQEELRALREIDPMDYRSIEFR